MAEGTSTIIVNPTELLKELSMTRQDEILREAALRRMINDSGIYENDAQIGPDPETPGLMQRASALVGRAKRAIKGHQYVQF